jgi:CheY-like chemotaxis protein
MSDIVMPEMTGYDLISAARESGFAGTFIIISGSSNQMPEEAILARVDSVFNKPINFKSLTSRLTFLLGPAKFENTKRKHERMPVDRGVRVRLTSGNSELIGQVGDIGRGGFFFSGALERLKPGTEVAVRIFYRNHNMSRVLDTSAIVRWAGPAGAGCEFNALDERAKAILDDLINYVKTNFVFGK